MAKGHKVSYYEVLEKPDWEDLRFPATSLQKPAANFPDRDSTDGTYLFDASKTELVFAIGQLPHGWFEASAIRPHLHWQPTTAGAGDVLWHLRYQIADINEAFPGTWTTLAVLGTASGDANMHQVSAFGPIDMTGYKISCIIKCEISRVGGDVTDTYAADAKLLEFDIHYQVDAPGSRQLYIK